RGRVYLAADRRTYVYVLSLHDALPIFGVDTSQLLLRVEEDRRAVGGGTGEGRVEGAVRAEAALGDARRRAAEARLPEQLRLERRDRKSTRLNSSHRTISYAVFCLIKKK